MDLNYGNYPNLTAVKRILVVKLRHHGDVLLTSPVFSALKRALPEASIDALVYADTAPMLEGHPAISQLLLCDRGWKKLSVFGRLRKEVSLLQRVRRGGYDLVINLTEGDRGAIAALVSGAPIRVGFDPEGKGFFGKRKAFTHIVKPCKTARHTVERQLDALRKIGIFPPPEERGLIFTIPEEAQEKMRKTLVALGLVPGEFILLHPVSRWRFKCPPMALIAEAIKLLEWPVLLTSGPDRVERAMIDEILSHNTGAHTVAGQTSLKELAALISLSRGVLCVDSVPLHMASALQVPVAVLFGPTSEQNWGPWMHPSAQIITSPHTCRPCGLDGCGGSKKSDCLATLSPLHIATTVHQLFSQPTTPLQGRRFPCL
jgi:heptosyltransferase-3